MMPTTVADKQMETLSQLLKRTIREGAPLYNEGKKKECYEIYVEAAKLACTAEKISKSFVGQLLERSVDEAMTIVQDQNDYDEAAWVLRHCFDEILDLQDKLAKKASTLTYSVDSSSSGSASFWQDEMACMETDLEKGQALADVAFVLRATIRPGNRKRFTRTYNDTFRGSEAVEVLATLGLVSHRKQAVELLQKLFQAAFLKPVSHVGESIFHDGTHLYRFASRAELQEALNRLAETVEGTDKQISKISLQTTLDLPVTTEDDSSSDNSPLKFFSGVSTRHLQARSAAAMTPEQSRGFLLAQFAATVEQCLDIQDRKQAFKSYPQCFVGIEAVSKLVTDKLATDRQQAVAQLSSLLDAGLIQHVTFDHEFKDKKLFYRFTPVKDLKKALDTLTALPEPPTSGSEYVRLVALVNRYKQFASLDVTKILNQFFGCETTEGWDLVDLQNWRDNMKRWGFGRREDQDNAMVDALAPLVLNIDPDSWNVENDEEWESPFGILAQIALFDQIPRSAFRGTPNAFKWDHLAIRATKVALEKGYFETAFKSTLNQFLLLLPLEHSESWEDQKLGVTLLLRMLSTVAVQDEDLTDYEIVKRLEFSKRLTTAFLEHAQVIAKFKRYPHRNRPLGRNTSLEERVWLASDLVPRWAKSQNPDESRNIIQLPVIPLKRLTRR